MVQEQAQVPFLLGQVFGFGTVTLTATSLANKGGALPPMHIMIVLDNTGSMNSQDGTGANCGNISNPTKFQCALAGIQTLLAELWPSQDEVGLIVFPPVNSSTASNDANCSSSKTITPEPYSSYPTSSRLPDRCTDQYLRSLQYVWDPGEPWLHFQSGECHLPIGFFN